MNFLIHSTQATGTKHRAPKRAVLVATPGNVQNFCVQMLFLSTQHENHRCLGLIRTANTARKGRVFESAELRTTKGDEQFEILSKFE